MTDTITLRVEGIPELREQFARLKDSTQRAVVRRALRAGVVPVKEEAERLAAYDPASDGPHLRDNLLVRTRISSEEMSASLGFDRRVFHGQFVELGTQHMPAQPFLRPALDTKQGVAIEAIADVLRDSIGRAVRRSRSLR